MKQKTSLTCTNAITLIALFAAVTPAWSADTTPQASGTNAQPTIATAPSFGDGKHKAGMAGASLNFYGMIDLGAEHVSGDIKGTPNSQAWRESNGVITPHYGVRGQTKDLGRGLRGSFDLEGSFTADNGMQGIGGRLFGRQSWVGVSGHFGTVRFGRQYTMLRMGWEDTNPFSAGSHGLKLLDPRISDPRADNAISYILHSGHFTGGANYSFGWDSVNGNFNSGTPNAVATDCAGEAAADPSQCRESSLAAKYDETRWGLSTSYERLNGGTSKTYGGLTSPKSTDTRYVLGGYLKLAGGRKLTVGWLHRNDKGNTATPVSNLHWVEGVFPFGGSYAFNALLGDLKYDNSPNKALLLGARIKWILSTDLTLYTSISNMQNGGTLNLAATSSTPHLAPTPGGKQTSVIAGILYKFDAGI